MSERGCGNRVAGGVYLECKVGGFGPPIQDFLLDPVRVIDVATLGIPSLGQVVERGEGGRSVIYDRVGVKHYPDAADLVEEILTLGVSRRVGKSSFPFENLGPGSTLALIHDRAALRQADDYREIMTPWRCPKRLHEAVTPYCLGSLYAMLSKSGTDVPYAPEDAAGHLFNHYFDFDPTSGFDPGFIDPFMRSRPSLNYLGLGYLPSRLSPFFVAAVVACVPVTNIAVVNDPEDPESVKKAVQTAQRGGVPVEIVNE